MHTNRQFRVSFEANRYSVPARSAGHPLTLKAYPDRLCVYHEQGLVARHVRSYARHLDIEEPDHPEASIAQRRPGTAPAPRWRKIALWLRAHRFSTISGPMRPPMSSVLAQVQHDTQQFSEAIGGIIDSDVEVVDLGMVRIAGTGTFRQRVNENMGSQGYVYRHAMQVNRTILIENPGQSAICTLCDQ